MFMKLSFEDQWSAGLICISLRNLPAAKFWGPPPLFYGLYTTQKPCPTPTGWWFGTWILFFHILEIIIPTDKLIFFRGVGIPPTSIVRCYSWKFYPPTKSPYSVSGCLNWCAYRAAQGMVQLHQHRRWNSWLHVCRLISLRHPQNTE